MRPIDKIREDLTYWEDQERQGKEMVAAAQSMLPGIRKALEALEAMDAGKPPAPPDTPPPDYPGGGDVTTLPKPEEGEKIAETSSDYSAESAPQIQLRGKCHEQVEAALGVDSPQSSIELVEFLAKYGRGYTRGAVDYALRDLRNAGKVVEAKKVGNLRYWKLAERAGQ